MERDEIERIIGACMYAHGEWTSPRVSDGVLTFEERAGVRGQIYEIDQSLHFFWLAGDRLFYDVVANSPRKARDAFDLARDPTELEWRITIPLGPKD